MANILDLDTLRTAVSGTAAAFRSRTKLQPAGGQGTKVFPPTYAGAVYAVEQRRLPGRNEPVTCVLLDSVQSQANRMEAALQDAVDGVLRDELKLTIPVIEVDFSDFGPDGDKPNDLRLIDSVGKVTSLQAPHRLADAILRDSVYQHNGKAQPFRKSEIGKAIDRADLRNATPLYKLCPTALVFGMWDSTGPKGGLGAKFERALVSEIVGIDCPYQYDGSEHFLPKNRGVRNDPVNASKHVGPVYRGKDGQMTLDPDEAEDEFGKEGKPTGKKRLWARDSKRQIVYHDPSSTTFPEQGKPSAANHGNVPFDGDNAGVTIEYAEQTTVLSLPALRRLRFPQDDEAVQPDKQRERDQAAQTVLAALALCAAELSTADMDLRSRCLLWPEEARRWQLLNTPGEEPKEFTLGAEAAVKLLREAVEAAQKTGVAWQSQPIRLVPSDSLVKLVRKSQEQAATESTEEGGE